MPFGTITLNPGVNTQLSQTANRQGWSLSNLVRWKDGLVEKIGGWAKISPNQMLGLCRGLHAWSDLSGNPYLIAGTDQRVYLYNGGALADITPLRRTANVTPDFSTIISDATVTVTDAANGAALDDWVYIQTQVSVGGLILSGFYQVGTLIGGNDYTIEAASLATSTVNNGGAVATFTTVLGFTTVTVHLVGHGLIAGDLYNVEVEVVVGGLTVTGIYSVTSVTDANNFVITLSSSATSADTVAQNSGNVRILYLLPTGLQSSAYLSGYGEGDYGEGDYGEAEELGDLVSARQWFFDTWGEDALGNYSDGPFYIWIPPLSVNRRATLVSQAPSMNTASFVAMPQQIAVALGCETGSARDPNLVRWSAVADYTDWTASATNQAGSFRIPTGSRIVGGIQGPQQGLIWTDLGVWSMRYVQPPFVFGFTNIANGCGLIAPRAIWTLGTDTYWMSSGGFFVLSSGGIQPVSCPVWDVIFRDLDMTQAAKIFAAGNADFNEIAFYFASASGDGEVDTYVKINTKERDQNGNPLWDYGSLARTAWEDRSAVGPPVGADINGYLQGHETGYDNDGVAMLPYIESGFFDIANGEDICFIDQLIPDLVRDSGTTLVITPKSVKVPFGTVKTYGPYQFANNAGYVSTRIRGRQVAFRFGSTGLGAFWRLGLTRYRFRPDGQQ